MLYSTNRFINTEMEYDRECDWILTRFPKGGLIMVDMLRYCLLLLVLMVQALSAMAVACTLGQDTIVYF